MVHAVTHEHKLVVMKLPWPDESLFVHSVRGHPVARGPDVHKREGISGDAY